MSSFKVAYIRRDNGACGYYRLKLPIETMARSNGTSFACIEKGDNAGRILEVLEGANIIVIPRIGETELLDVLPEMKANGKKVVIDHDDNMFNISPLSPHYEEAGTENVRYRLPDGTFINLWQDGKNIDLTYNRKRCENFKKAMEVADMVTVTTDILADVYREFNPNVRALPNCVDTKLWQKLPLKERCDVRLCWFGGSSHYEDWLLLAEVLPEIMDRNRNVKLVLMGMKFDAVLKDIEKNRIEFHPWVHTEAYPYKAAILDCDIAVIPLVENDFNRCKSPIKWIEQAALGIPSVTSYVSPYKEIATDDNGVFIENNDVRAWIEGINTLVEYPSLRKNMGEAARQTVMDKFDINTQYIQWQKAYEELL